MQRIVVVAIIGVAAACGGGPAGPTVDFRVSGKVFDYMTGVGVANATVSFSGSTAITDNTGAYNVLIPESGVFQPTIDGRVVGTSLINGPSYRGDFFVNPGICVGRYGTVTDAKTLRPIVGATVDLGGTQALSASDGWYRMDLGCPTNSPVPGLIGIGTTFMQIWHTGYVTLTAPAGKGISGLVRADFELKPQ